MCIEPFHSQDLDELVGVWNRSLPADLISAARLEARVLLDPNFREAFFLVARDEARIVGFALGICGEGFCYQAEQVPPERMGSRAWILALAVEREHRGRDVGTALLRELEERFREAGKREVWIASYPTAYLVPGVDEAAYAEGLAFLQRKGYRVAYTALAMDASLWPPAHQEGAIQAEQDLAAQGIVFHTYAPRWLSPFRAFLRQEVPWDWEYLALRNLARLHEGTFSAAQIHLAIHEGQVVGYCQYEGAHFGPFGVARGYQGRGIGTVLLARALYAMAQQGLHNAWVLWTGERAAALYARFGFQVSRRFAVLHKEVQ
jgi:GNAT superfamily N-acetyltransferase